MLIFPTAPALSQEQLAALIHKLRGPLAAISAQAETLAEGILGPLSPKQSEAVRAIRQEIEHSLHQIEGLEDLWIQRPAAESAASTASELHDLCQGVIADFATELENRQVTLQLDSARPLPESSPPAAQLRRLLRGLLACQLALVRRNTIVRLHLSSLPADAGKLENHPQVQAQLVRLEPLSLLLLHKAGKVVLLNDGRTLPSLGLQLPQNWSCWMSLQPVETNTWPVSNTEAQPTASPSQLILLADDQETLASVLASYLQDLGYRVKKAADGLEVVRLARELHPNLILMDLRMPLLSGIEALRQIRQAVDESTRTIPVICMSGFSTAAEETRCLTAGANAFLRKPFRPAELLELLPRTCPSSRQ